MAYRPPRVKTSYDRIKGLAKVAIHSKTGDAKVNFKDNKTFIVKAENVQADPVWKGVGFCEVSENGQYFYSMRPMKGLFDGMCVGLAAPDDGEPTPSTKDSRWGGTYQTFIALLQIREGKYQGATYPYMVSYKFENADGVAALPGQRGKSRYTDQLEDFMYAVGAWEKPLEWSENMLPEIDRRIKNSARHFKFSVKDGYVDQLIDVEITEEPEEVDWDD